ncbi:hypothetical protein [Tetragenococcus koreensis]|uniref:hypothetical protein n=1 Tax=Tetragenococcus koreensis TaxID=290335 RepID=UPI001F3F5671|nr:hypothetical protein [Tetragenococcus koreensis]MCF1633096.1 hypothetical protein [Tetragenococcus koreensis]
MNEIEYTKEVTYIFEYQDYEYKITHYRDNITNLRYSGPENMDRNEQVSVLSYPASGATELVIYAPLLAVEILDENDEEVTQANLIYLLPDVNRYCVMTFNIYIDPGSNKHIEWFNRY